MRNQFSRKRNKRNTHKRRVCIWQIINYIDNKIQEKPIIINFYIWISGSHSIIYPILFVTVRECMLDQTEWAFGISIWVIFFRCFYFKYDWNI